MAKRRGNNEGTISKRPDGRWIAQLTIGRDPSTGKLKRRTFYGRTRKEADDKLTRAKHDRSRGVFVPLHKLAVGDWLSTWLREYKKPRVRSITYDNYEMVIRRHLSPALGHIPLQALRPEYVQNYYNTKIKDGMAASTLRLHHVVLVHALGQAEKNHLVLRNVCRLTELHRRERKEMKTLAVQQLRTQLLPAIRKDRLYAAFYLAFATGLRRGELLALRWQDVNLKTGILNVRQTLIRISNQDGDRKTKLVFSEPKTPQSRRTIPIPKECLLAIRYQKAQQAKDKLLFGTAYEDHDLISCQPDGKPMDPRNFNRFFNQAIKRAGLPHIRLHDCRHTFATLLLEQGVSPKVVQTMRGHSSIAVTLDIYSHVSLELERQAAAKLNEVLSSGLQ